MWAAPAGAERPRNPAAPRQRLRQRWVNELVAGGYGLRVTGQCLTCSTARHRVWSMRTAITAISLYALILAVVAGATWLGNGGHYGIDDQPRVEQATYSDTVEDATCPTADPCAAVAGQTDVEQLGIYTEQPAGNSGLVELVAIPVDQASPEFVGSLLEGGWHGIAGDGQEAIYAPREVALQLCLTHTDCALAEGLVQA